MNVRTNISNVVDQPSQRLPSSIGYLGHLDKFDVVLVPVQQKVFHKLKISSNTFESFYFARINEATGEFTKKISETVVNEWNSRIKTHETHTVHGTLYVRL